MNDKHYIFKILSVFGFIILNALFFLPDLRAATNCEQELVLLGKTQNKSGNPIIWIADNVSGECLWTRIVRLELLKDSVIDSLEQIGYKDWQKIGQRINTRFVNSHAEFKKSDGLWLLGDKDWIVEIPQPDSNILTDYKSWNLSTSELPSWNKEKGMKAIMAPEIEGVKTELLYAYPRGMYINYSIDRICYYGEKEYFYLLIFTRQPKLAAGFDSMHGFLLLKGKY